MTTDLVKRYALSSTVTFLSTFFLILGTNVQSITNPSTITFSVVAGLLLVAGRAATKAVIEAIVGGHADLQQIGSSSTPPPQA